MHRLAHASAEERRRIMNDFLDHIFAGLDVDPGFEARFRTAMPELPDDPTDEQVDAWVELAELVGDEDFRARIRGMSEAAWGGEPDSRPAPPSPEENARLVAFVEDRVQPALAAGVDPASPEAAALVDALLGDRDRAAVAARWETGTDARAERYWQLIGTINGWPPIPARVPAFEWLIAAVRASLGR